MIRFFLAHRLVSSLVPLLLVTLVGAGLATPPAAANVPAEPLTLRVDDVVALPGGIAAVVIRTYASRGIGQGQLCIVAGGSIDALEEAVVFSTADDVTSSATFDAQEQIAELSFTSPSGTVNAVDGPLAVLFFRVDDNAAAGTEEPLSIAVDSLVFRDETGALVPLETRAGELGIRAPTAPFELSADGDRVAPGALVEIGATTEESLPLSSGTIVLRYDPALSDETPQVLVDDRYGEASYSVEHPAQGTVRVRFNSPDASFNIVPGALVSLRLRVALDRPIGSMLDVWLDPATELFNALGQPLTLELTPDVIEIEAPTPLFRDGFESGDLTGWCAAVP